MSVNYEEFYEASSIDKLEIVLAGGLPVHTSANIVPLSPNFDGLAESIKKNGLRLPIVTYKGEIIDGRRRAIACASVNVSPRVDEIFDASKELSPEELYQLVLDYNNRRSLIKAQQAVIASIEAQKGNHIKAGYKRAQDFAKGVFDVSPVTYKKARLVLKEEYDTAIRIFETGYGFDVEGKPETLSKAYDRIKARLSNTIELYSEGNVDKDIEDLREELKILMNEQHEWNKEREELTSQIRILMQRIEKCKEQ